MKVIFVSATKIGRNTNNILKLLYFTINLHFVTWNQTFTDRKLNLPFTSSIHVSFLPLEMQKWLEQTKIYHTFSYVVWQETTHKPLQVPAAKTFFSSVYVIRTTCFDECFLFYVITGRNYFSWKININLNFFKHHVAAFFEASVLEEVNILGDFSTITIWCKYQSSKIKLSFLNFLIFVTNFIFVTAPYFPLLMKFFFINKISLYKWNL